MSRVHARWCRAKFVAVVVAWAAAAGGAGAQTRDDAGLWLALFANGKYESRNDTPFRYWFDGQARFLNDAGGFNQLLIRPGLGYEYRDDQTLWYGYAYVRTDSIILPEGFDEHRMWQQWMATPSAGRWLFVHRSRLEQRWVETGGDVGHRFRQFARAQYRLTDTPEWSLIAWDEAFVHLNDTDWGARAGFDQNRLCVGVGYKANPDARSRLEVGYLNQFLRREGAQNTINHIVSVSVFY